MSNLASFRRGWVSLSQDFREGVVLGEYFLLCTKLHILLSDSANCIILRSVVLTQYQCVTDGWTDRIAVASTALAMLGEHCGALGAL